MIRVKVLLAVFLMLVLLPSTVIWATVSYLGPDGTSSGEAAKKYFGENEKLVHSATVTDALNEVLASRADYAVVPAETTFSGFSDDISLVTDEYKLVVVGEIVLPVRQTLLGVKGAQLSDIQIVLAHPTAFTDSASWLKNNLPKVKTGPVASSAAGAKEVAERNDKSFAAIAPANTALIYRLDILASNLEYVSSNSARFWVVAASNRFRDRGNKATLLVEGNVQNLHRFLNSLERESLTVTAIHNYPAKTKLGQYKFLVEVTNNDPKDKKELTPSLITAAKQHKNSLQIRIIGIYDQAG